MSPASWFLTGGDRTSKSREPSGRNSRMLAHGGARDEDRRRPQEASVAEEVSQRNRVPVRSRIRP